MLDHEFTAVVVSRTTTEDRYGDTTITETRTPVDRVLYAPRASQERADNRVPTIYVAGTLYFLEGLPATVMLDSDDSIEITDVHPLIDGAYQVEGIPGYWGGPVEVAVTRTGRV